MMKQNCGWHCSRWVADIRATCVRLSVLNKLNKTGKSNLFFNGCWFLSLFPFLLYNCSHFRFNYEITDVQWCPYVQISVIGLERIGSYRRATPISKIWTKSTTVHSMKNKSFTLHIFHVLKATCFCYNRVLAITKC